MSDKWRHPNWRIRWAQRLRPKWRVADAANRSVRWCWADLVDWCLQKPADRRRDYDWYRKNGWGRYEAWRDAKSHRLTDRSGVRCQVESAICGSCYCGKFRDGALFAAAPVSESRQ